VPLGHFPHPEISQTYTLFSRLFLLEIARLLKDISRFWFISVWRKPWRFLKCLHPLFWAVFSSISGTHQIADLAIFFNELSEGFQRDCKTVCETPGVLALLRVLQRHSR
jgi:hypothetical protein